MLRLPPTPPRRTARNWQAYGFPRRGQAPRAPNVLEASRQGDVGYRGAGHRACRCRCRVWRAGWRSRSGVARGAARSATAASPNIGRVAGMRAGANVSRGVALRFMAIRYGWNLPATGRSGSADYPQSTCNGTAGFSSQWMPMARVAGACGASRAVPCAGRAALPAGPSARASRSGRSCCAGPTCAVHAPVPH